MTTRLVVVIRDAGNLAARMRTAGYRPTCEP